MKFSFISKYDTIDNSMLKGDYNMAYYRGRKEPVREEETTVWSCTNDSCLGWMRDAFTSEDNPTCPLCQSTMEKEKRVLPVIE